jgi:hypothetical protein
MLMHDAEFHRADGEIAGMGGARAVIERLLEGRDFCGFALEDLPCGVCGTLLVPRGDDNREESSGLGFRRRVWHFYSFPIQTGRPAARARLA